MNLHDWDNQIKHDQRIRKAWPNVPTIHIDRAFAENNDLPPTVYYAFFDGYERRAPCAQLHIAPREELLPTERDPACWDHIPTPNHLRSSLGWAINHSVRQPGNGTTEAAQAMASVLAKLGIQRGPRSYGYRTVKLSELDRRIASVLCTCFRHLILPGRDPWVKGLFHPAAAHPILAMRGPQVQSAQNHRTGYGHGYDVRRIA